MPLSDRAVRHALPAKRDYKMHDAGGLYLLIRASGSKLWRIKYRTASRERGFSLGAWPAVSLAAARRERDLIRADILRGQDPATVRRTARAELAAANDSVEQLARDWLVHMKSEVSEGQLFRQKRRLELYVLPKIGRRRVTEVETPEIIAILRPLEAVGKIETATRVRTILGQVFRWAIASGRAVRNPAADTAGALKTARARHMPRASDPGLIGDILRRIDGYPGSPVVRAALQLAPLLVPRPGELRKMRWSELVTGTDGEPVWRFELSKARKGQPARFQQSPLTKRASEILAHLQSATGGQDDKFVFPGLRPGRTISENTLNLALRALDVDTQETHTSHGWRGTFSTIAHEAGANTDWIESQLGHIDTNKVRRAYNEAQYLAQRRALMNWYTAVLDGWKSGQKTPGTLDLYLNSSLRLQKKTMHSSIPPVASRAAPHIFSSGDHSPLVWSQ